MALKCGIVGLPNVGKSTLFNALSSADAQAANFPFCTIEPNLGVIQVPDPRINKLAALVHPQRTVSATVEIVDIAGLVKGASKGEGLGNMFLSNIRECQAIIHVIRCFDDGNVVHVDGSVDPLRDKGIIETELMLKDLESIEKKFDKAIKIAKGGDKEAKIDVELLEILKPHLERGHPARTLAISDEAHRKAFDRLTLLTAKPVIFVCNVDEGSTKDGNTHSRQLLKVANEDEPVLLISAAIESEIAKLDSEEDRKMFLEEMGLTEPGASRLLRTAYDRLNLITFFTAGPKEVRAWTLRKGAAAPEAAGVIHSDFEKGFIRAEQISYSDFVHFGSEQACREAGKMNVQGKSYVVRDGDILHFRFNV